LPVRASSFNTLGGAVRYIIPFFTTCIARELAGGPGSGSDRHAAPSVDTFLVLIWSSGE
jgi:hypothetical protein